LPPRGQTLVRELDEGLITPPVILEESIREKCVYIVSDNEMRTVTMGYVGGDNKWFSYMYNMYVDCIGNDRFDLKKCAEQVMWEVGVDKQKVNKCIEDSFENYQQNGLQGYNQMIETDAQESRFIGFTMHPAVTINGAIYRGDLDGADIFSAICNAFKSKDSRPSYCSRDFDIQVKLGAIEDLMPPMYKNATMTNVALALFAIISINCCLLLAYRKWNKDNTQKEIEMQVE
jgi:hypothetical protein